VIYIAPKSQMRIGAHMLVNEHISGPLILTCYPNSQLVRQSDTLLSVTTENSFHF